MLLFLLDEILFLPAILVTAALIAIAFFWRRMSDTYRYFWWTVVIAGLLVTLCYTLYSLSIPMYSQQDHSPDNPGGPGKWSSPPAVFTVLFLITFVLIPSFPTLFALACLPPRNLRSPWRILTPVLIALYVVIALTFIYSKHIRYMADYHQERAKQKQGQFEQRRNSPLSPSQQQQQKRLQERIEQRQEQEHSEQPLA